MAVMLAVAATVAILVIWLGLYLPQTAPDPVRARLSQFAERPVTLEEIELERPFTDRVLRPVAGKLTGLLTKVLARRKRGGSLDSLGVAKVQRRLILAGSPKRFSANEFVGIIILSMLAFAGALFLLVGVAGGNPLTAIYVALLGAGIGFMIPNLWISSLIGSRQKEIQRAMPDALDLLVISVEAGLGFDAALQRLTEKANNALTREFRRAISEIKMGRPRREALKDMITRTEVPDLSTFISAVIQADQLGVSVSRVLTVQAEQMRLLRRQRAEETANKAPLKMLFPMVFLIFPALFIVIIGPSVPTITGSGF